MRSSAAAGHFRFPLRFDLDAVAITLEQLAQQTFAFGMLFRGNEVGQTQQSRHPGMPTEHSLQGGIHGDDVPFTLALRHTDRRIGEQRAPFRPRLLRPPRKLSSSAHRNTLNGILPGRNPTFSIQSPSFPQNGNRLCPKFRVHYFRMHYRELPLCLLRTLVTKMGNLLWKTQEKHEQGTSVDRHVGRIGDRDRFGQSESQPSAAFQTNDLRGRCAA